MICNIRDVTKFFAVKIRLLMYQSPKMNQNSYVSGVNFPVLSPNAVNFVTKIITNRPRPGAIQANRLPLGKRKTSPTP
jgi:hypothetical protein